MFTALALTAAILAAPTAQSVECPTSPYMSDDPAIVEQCFPWLLDDAVGGTVTETPAPVVEAPAPAPVVVEAPAPAPVVEEAPAPAAAPAPRVVAAAPAPVVADAPYVFGIADVLELLRTSPVFGWLFRV